MDITASTLPPRSTRQFPQHRGQYPPVNCSVPPVSSDPPPSRVQDSQSAPVNPYVSPNCPPPVSLVSQNSNIPIANESPDSPSVPLNQPIHAPENSRVPDIPNTLPSNPDVPLTTRLPPADPSVTVSVGTESSSIPSASSCDPPTDPTVPVTPNTPSIPNVPLTSCLSENPSLPVSPDDPPNPPGTDISVNSQGTNPCPQTTNAPLDDDGKPELLRCENITKSESDKRQYRALVLPNQMKVMLVSDSSAETSAAALQVNVGHCSDPDALPGLAHFCEHMLFLGTEKYPEENEYSKFLSEHGGFSNACTGTDFTKYYCNVLPDHLPMALDIFAQFFIAPLFTESATERELNAVDSEHQNNVQSDGWRIMQLNKSAASAGHPFRKFGTGNRQTLETTPKEKGIDVREKLLQFHQRWYSANIMALSVVGKETLDELEAMVVPLFSTVKNSSVETPTWPEHPYPPALRRKRTYCEPVADFRSLAIEFPISNYTREHYVGRPFNYLSNLIGHEGPGSLLSALKKRGWCDSLASGTFFPARGFGFFEITVELTEDGVNHVDDITALTFQYIAMLRSSGPLLEVYEELSELSDLAFRFEDPSEPIWLANSLVNVLQEFPSLPVEEALATWRATDWRPDLIEEALSLLTPENVRLQIKAKCFAEKCTQEEPWYGTKYLEEDIEPEKIKEWESLAQHPELLMPPPNEFIPSRLELEDRTDPTCEAVAPEIIRDTPFMRLWYKQDNEFLLPKASIEFELNSPVPAQSPRNMQLTILWMMLVEDSLQESTYAAGLASLNWSLDWCLYSISVAIGGFDDKQHLLLEIIMDRIADFRPDPRRFAVMKEKIIRLLKNRETDQPCEHAEYEQDSSLSERVWWTTQQFLDAVEGTTVEMLVDYMPRFLRNVYVEGIAFGNLTRARALRLAEIVESRIPKDAVPVLAQDLLMVRALEIDAGGYYLREIENAVHSSSCASVYLECGVCDTRPNVILELLVKVLQEPCFDRLRTKEQLGYIVSGGVRRGIGVQGATVLVQGDLHPARIEERIEAFLLDVQEYLENMSDEEFTRHRSALVSLRLERPKQISSKKNQMWGEILAQTYNFDRDRVEADVLKTISKEELILFYKKHISPSSPERRKLCVHVVSTAEGGAGHSANTGNRNNNNCTDNMDNENNNIKDRNETDNNKDSTDDSKENIDNLDSNSINSNIDNKMDETDNMHKENNEKTDSNYNENKKDKTDNIKENIDNIDSDSNNSNTDSKKDNTDNIKSEKTDYNERNSKNIYITNETDNNKENTENTNSNDNDDKNDSTENNKENTDNISNKNTNKKCNTNSSNMEQQRSLSSDNAAFSLLLFVIFVSVSYYLLLWYAIKSIFSYIYNTNNRVKKNENTDINQECLDNKNGIDIDHESSYNNNVDNRNDNTKDNKQPIKITDFMEFKARRRLHPRPVAFTAVPKRGS